MRLEDELRRALKEEVSGVGSSEEAWRSIEHRLGRESSGRPGSRIAVIALALTLSAASLTGLWLGFRPDPVDRSDRERTAGEPVDLQPRVTAVIPVGPYPQDVAVGEGAVWVSVPAQEPSQDDLVVRVDSGTNEVVARIPVDGYIEELVAGAGGVWGVGVQGNGPDLSLYVDRIDPATNEVVARIPDLSGPLAVGEGALWAVDHAGARAGLEGSNLLRIDPATNQIVARIALWIAAWDIEFGEGYVWVLSLDPGTGEEDILQVDPATNELLARIDIPLPGTVYAPALGDGSAWVPVCCVDNELMLVRVDVGTSQIVGEPIRLPGGAPFAFAAGHVWVVEERGALYGLNVATSEVDEMVSGFGWPAGGFPDPSTELDPGRLAVWVVNYQDSVTRIDLKSADPPRLTRSLQTLALECGPGSETIVSEQVAAQSDGVHIEVTSSSWPHVLFKGLGMSVIVDGTRASLVLDLPPGIHRVGCGFSGEGEVVEYVPFEVVDPNSYWVDPTLDCPGKAMGAEYVNNEPLTIDGDPTDEMIAFSEEEFAGRFSEAGSEAGSVVVVGYPESDQRLVGYMSTSGSVLGVVRFHGGGVGADGGNLGLWLPESYRACES